jgi:DNA repair exonuclease SbcCD ATPase subunit
MTILTIEAKLSQLKATYQQESGKLELLQEQLNTKTIQLEQAKRDIEVWQKVKMMLAKAADFSREQLKIRIEETVTAALQGILLRDDIRFAVETWMTADSKPNARWKIVSSCDGQVVESEPEDGNGGGVTDVVSLALRAALLELSKPKPGGPFGLDEPGKMVSKEYLPNVADFFKRYLGKTGRQGLIITHHDILAECADVGYRVSQTNGISEVVQV